MIFYHHTTQESSEEILSTLNGLGIKISEFDLHQYLISFFKEDVESLEIDQDGYFIDLKNNYETIIDGRSVVKNVPWLGKGLYCFTETNLDAARQYNDSKLDVMLEVSVDKSKCGENNIFNMTNKNKTKLLIHYLENDYLEMYEFFTEDQVKYLEMLRLILLTSVKNNYKGMPHAAGILIELFLEQTGEEYKIVKCSFMLGGSKPSKPIWIDEYVAIRDHRIISNVASVENAS